MAKTDELEDFIRLAVAKGEPLSRIESVLLESGWETERVKRAVGRYVDVDFSVPVPKPRPFVSTRRSSKIRRITKPVVNATVTSFRRVSEVADSISIR